MSNFYAFFAWIEKKIPNNSFSKINTMQRLDINGFMNIMILLQKLFTSWEVGYKLNRNHQYCPPRQF